MSDLPGQLNPPTVEAGQLSKLAVDNLGRLIASSSSPAPVPSAATSGATGQITPGGAATKLAAATTNFNRGLAIGNLSSSTGSAWIGWDNTVSASSGYELPPGVSIALADVFNASLIWVFAAAGVTVSYIGATAP